MHEDSHKPGCEKQRTDEQSQNPYIFTESRITPNTANAVMRGQEILKEIDELLLELLPKELVEAQTISHAVPIFIEIIGYKVVNKR